MAIDTQLIAGPIAEYYNSVREKFSYRTKHDWKINLSDFLFMLSVLALFFNIIPILPLFGENYLGPLYEKIKAFIGLPNQEYNFWLKWALGSACSLTLLGILFIPFKYWNIMEGKHALRKKLLNFCHTYAVHENIKNYLLNEDESHLDNCVEDLQEILSDVSSFRVKAGSKSNIMGIKRFRDEIILNTNWFNVTEETNAIIDAFISVEAKIEERITQKTELEAIQPTLEALVLHEFSKIKPEYKNSEGVRLKEKSGEYLTDFVEEIGKLSEFEITSDTKDTKTNKFKEFRLSVVSLFTSSNIVTLFFSWLILLGLLFVIPAMGVIDILDLKIDSTILVGLLSAPFVGAITFTLGIYSHSKK